MIALNEKEPSSSRKFKNFMAKYSTYNVLSLGGKVWKCLDAVLPKAVGAHITDEPRIKKFQEKVKELSFRDHYALKVWLKSRYKEMEDASFGLITGSQEQYCEKWMQIYSEHFNVME